MVGEQGMRMGLGSMMAMAPRRTNIMGQPHMLSYINPQEEMVLRQMGGSGLPGPSGIPSYYFTFDDYNVGSGAVSSYDDFQDRESASDNRVFSFDDDDEDYTPTAAELVSQLSDLGLDDLRSDTSDVDFGVTGSGQDFTTSAEADRDVSGFEFAGFDDDDDDPVVVTGPSGYSSLDATADFYAGEPDDSEPAFMDDAVADFYEDQRTNLPNITGVASGAGFLKQGGGFSTDDDEIEFQRDFPETISVAPGGGFSNLVDNVYGGGDGVGTTIGSDLVGTVTDPDQTGLEDFAQERYLSYDTGTTDDFMTGLDPFDAETVEQLADQYYESGAGSPGATGAVDFSQTGSGEDFTDVAQSDDAVTEDLIETINIANTSSEDVSLPAEAVSSDPNVFNYTGDYNFSYGGSDDITYGINATANAQPFSNIVFHHTGNNYPLANQVNYGQTFDEDRGGTFGYHFYVGKDGSIVQGAPLDARTNHIYSPDLKDGFGDVNNTNSIGISLVGADDGDFTAVQRAAAADLARDLQRGFGTITGVYGQGAIQSGKVATEGVAMADLVNSGADVSQEDTLSVGDSFKVTIGGEFPSETTVTVDEDGIIKIPNYAPFPVDGLTVPEVTNALEDILLYDDDSATVKITEGDTDVSQDVFGEDYTPSAADLSAQLEGAGLPDLRVDSGEVGEIGLGDTSEILGENISDDGLQSLLVDLNREDILDLGDTPDDYDTKTEFLNDIGALFALNSELYDDTILGGGEGGLRDTEISQDDIDASIDTLLGGGDDLVGGGSVIIEDTDVADNTLDQRELFETGQIGRSDVIGTADDQPAQVFYGMFGDEYATAEERDAADAVFGLGAGDTEAEDSELFPLGGADAAVGEALDDERSASRVYLDAAKKDYQNLTEEEQRVLYGARGQVPNAAETAYLQTLLRDVDHAKDGPVDEREFIRDDDGNLIVNPNQGQLMYQAGDPVVKQTLGETAEDFIVKLLDIFVNPLSIFGEDYTFAGMNEDYVQEQLNAYYNGGTFVYDGAGTVVGIATPNYDVDGDGENDTVVTVNEDGNYTVVSRIDVSDVDSTNENADDDTEVDDIDIIYSNNTFENTEDGVVVRPRDEGEDEGDDDDGCPDGYVRNPETGLCVPIDEIDESIAAIGSPRFTDVRRPTATTTPRPDPEPSEAVGLTFRRPSFAEGGIVTPNIDRFMQSLRG